MLTFYNQIVRDALRWREWIICNTGVTSGVARSDWWENQWATIAIRDVSFFNSVFNEHLLTTFWAQDFCLVNLLQGYKVFWNWVGVRTTLDRHISPFYYCILFRTMDQTSGQVFWWICRLKSQQLFHWLCTLVSRNNWTLPMRGHIL